MRTLGQVNFEWHTSGTPTHTESTSMKTLPPGTGIEGPSRLDIAPEIMEQLKHQADRLVRIHGTNASISIIMHALTANTTIATAEEAYNLAVDLTY
jgi:hypothetical protein